MESRRRSPPMESCARGASFGQSVELGLRRIAPIWSDPTAGRVRTQALSNVATKHKSPASVEPAPGRSLVANGQSPTRTAAPCPALSSNEIAVPETLASFSA